MPYIINTIRSSHAEFLDRLTANLEKRDVDGLSIILLYNKDLITHFDAAE